MSEAILIQINSKVDDALAGLKMVSQSVDGTGLAAARLTTQSNLLAQAQVNVLLATQRLTSAQAALAANTDPSKELELTKVMLDAQVAMDGASQKVTALSGTLKNDLPAASQAGAQSTNLIKGSLTELKAGIDLVGLSVQTLKGVWDFAREGAQVQRVEEQFNHLAASLNIDSKSMIAALDEAAHGTVDDTALMQTATRAFATGVITNQTQLVGLMEVARASSVAFGGDTTDAFNRISMAVENLMPRALKQAGIIVDLKKANEDWAKANGRTVASLTDEEKRQALLNQVLAKGSDLVKKLGQAGDDTATSMDRVSKHIQDAKESVEKFFAAGVAAGVKIFTGAGDTIDIYSQHLADMRKETLAGKYTLAEYNAEVVRSTEVVRKGLNLDDDWAAAQTKVNTVTQQGIDLMKAQAVAVTDASDRTRGLTAATDDLTAAQKANVATTESQYQIAIAYTDQASKMADEEKKLADLDATIAAQGPRHIAIIQDKDKSTAKLKLSTQDLIVVQDRLKVAEESLTNIAKKKNETDLQFQLRIDQTKSSVAKLTAEISGATGILGTHSAVVGGATEKQLAERQAILDTIDAMETADVKAAGMKGFDAVNKQFETGAIDVPTYESKMALLNTTFDIFDQSQLAASIHTAEFMKVLADPKASAQDFQNALFGIKDAAKSVDEKLTTVATKSLPHVNAGMESMTGNADGAIASLGNLGSALSTVSTKDPSGGGGVDGGLMGGGGANAKRGPVSGVAAIATAADISDRHLGNLGTTLIHTATIDPSLAPIQGLNHINDQAVITTTSTVILGQTLNLLPNIERTIHYKTVIDPLPSDSGYNPNSGGGNNQNQNGMNNNPNSGGRSETHYHLHVNQYSGSLAHEFGTLRALEGGG